MHNKTRDIEFWFDVISLKQHLCSPMTSLSCWGMSSFHWLMDGWAKSMLMSRYWGASRLVLKVKTVPSFVTYSYSASKLSISFTHGNKPVIIKIYMRSCQRKPSIFIWILMFLCVSVPVIPCGTAFRSQYHSLLTGSQPSRMDNST